jgi:transcriptional pleiotropic repressor
VSILAKTRRLNKLLQKSGGHAVNFMDMAEVLREAIHADVYVVSRKGKILGFSMASPYVTPGMNIMVVEERRFPEGYNAMFLQIDETTSNNDMHSAYSILIAKIHDFFKREHSLVVPIIGGGQRWGTLVLTSGEQPFDETDLVLAEYGATVVGMEILRVRADEIEQETRNKAIVQVAISSLSFSEQEAVGLIFDELNGTEGLLVASKIADRADLTRSVIVNALRKLESAGVIETRSLGMKGTYIKILNEQIVTEIRHFAK